MVTTDESGLVELMPEGGPFPEAARTERLSMRANLCTVCGVRVWSVDVARHVAWHLSLSQPVVPEVDTPVPDPLDVDPGSGVSS